MSPEPRGTTAGGVDRLGEMFARCRAAGEAALVTYVMGGDPDLATSKAMALACVEGGADLVEIDDEAYYDAFERHFGSDLRT